MTVKIGLVPPEETEDENEETEDTSILDAVKKNKENQDRLKKERAKANKSVLRDNNIK